MMCGTRSSYNPEFQDAQHPSESEGGLIMSDEATHKAVSDREFRETLFKKYGLE